jgi:hypothetical protein
MINVLGGRAERTEEHRTLALSRAAHRAGGVWQRGAECA